MTTGLGSFSPTVYFFLELYSKNTKYIWLKGYRRGPRVSHFFCYVGQSERCCLWTRKLAVTRPALFMPYLDSLTSDLWEMNFIAFKLPFKFMLFRLQHLKWTNTLTYNMKYYRKPMLKSDQFFKPKLSILNHS